MYDEADVTGLPDDRRGESNGNGEFAAADVERLTEQVAGLQEAVLTRDVIGQAKGILMERHKITAEEAFERLRSASQHQNRKLRDIAEELATTGSIPDL
jgi:AmiR/NasT family two-component response regulator